MSRRSQLAKHLQQADLFGVGTKIKEFRKPFKKRKFKKKR